MSNNRTPIPNDFFRNKPPARIIGTESECNVQLPAGYSENAYISPQAIEKAGYARADGTYSGSYLSNGTRIYIDVGHVEVDTAEALGPRQAAAADAAGILMIAKIIESSGIPHNGVHRHSGTIINGKEKTSGYHENFMFPRSIADNPLIDTMVASHLTSRMWAMSGMLGDGFQLSQKVKGIGDPAITRTVERRTQHSNKPMAMIPPVTADADTVGNQDWARLEVRFADAGFSLTAQYLGFAATSLVLRLVEHERIINSDLLKDFSFKSHAATAKRFNTDLNFTQTAETLNGKQISALDNQEILIGEIAKLSEKVKLPKDEEAAIPLWVRVCDEMRKSDINNGYYANLPILLDFAPRHRFQTRKFKDNLNSHNPYATEANLSWDRILPKGLGMKYWESIPTSYVSKEEVDNLVYNPPPTRAVIRSAIIADKHNRARSATWSSIEIRSGKIRMPDSYATER